MIITKTQNIRATLIIGNTEIERVSYYKYHRKCYQTKEISCRIETARTVFNRMKNYLQSEYQHIIT